MEDESRPPALTEPDDRPRGRGGQAASSKKPVIGQRPKAGAAEASTGQSPTGEPPKQQTKIPLEPDFDKYPKDWLTHNARKAGEARTSKPPTSNSHVPLPKPPWTVHCKLHRRFDKDGRELKPYPSAATTRALAA